MEKMMYILCFCSMMLTARSQNASVEKSFLGIQAGFLGVWVHHEVRLSEEVAFRTEVGLDGVLWGGAAYNRTGFYMSPVVTAEPRWYYNLKQRQNKSKKTSGNSANFISLRTSYHPEGFILSSEDNVEVVSDLTIVPTWGVRRYLGKHFHYEAGAGAGYRYIFWERSGLPRNESTATLHIHLRLGYTF
jgi:hypothetical protein